MSDAHRFGAHPEEPNRVPTSPCTGIRYGTGVSRLYARNHDTDRTGDGFVLKLDREVGELTQTYLARCGQSRHTGTDKDPEVWCRAEIADVLVHLLRDTDQFDVWCAADR